MKSYVIYCATNKINNKSYVGQSYQFEERKKKHIWNANLPYKRCAFQAALKKYGADAFDWVIIEENLTLDEANEAEEFYIAYLMTLTPNGYNILKGGLNREMHPDTKKLLSEKLKIVGSFVGKKGKDHPNWGRKLSQEHKDKVSKAHSGENGPNRKITSVIARSIYEEFLAGSSTSELAKKYGLNSKITVSNILNKRCWKDATKDLPPANTLERNNGNFSPNSKLIEKDVIDILKIFSNMEGSTNKKCEMLAKKYDVGSACIRDIIIGKSWKHVPR